MPNCKISRCQVSVASKWQLASRRHLLQICCPPSVLLSSVQGLTDHPCCAAGSRKNQNHNSEEHLDAGSASVCVAEMLSAVIYSGGMFTILHVTQHLMISYQSCVGEPYNIQIFNFCHSVAVTYLTCVFLTLSIGLRTCCFCATWVFTAWNLIKVKVPLINLEDSEKGWNVGFPSLLIHSAQLGQQSCQLHALSSLYPHGNSLAIITVRG